MAGEHTGPESGRQVIAEYIARMRRYPFILIGAPLAIPAVIVIAVGVSSGRRWNDSKLQEAAVIAGLIGLILACFCCCLLASLMRGR